MKNTKKMITSLLVVTCLSFSTSNLHADQCQEPTAVIDCGGEGYVDCCRSSSLAPAIALGAMAVVAIVAVALQNTSGHSHCHSH